MVCADKSMVNSVAGSASIALNISSKKGSDTCTGRMPILIEFPLKISAKKLDTTQRNP